MNWECEDTLQTSLGRYLRAREIHVIGDRLDPVRGECCPYASRQSTSRSEVKTAGLLSEGRRGFHTRPGTVHRHREPFLAAVGEPEKACVRADTIAQSLQNSGGRMQERRRFREDPR